MRLLLVVALGVAVLVLPQLSQAAPAPTAPVLTRDSVCSAPTPFRLTVRSGVNEVLAIARGHLNRLITPFDKPRATTVNEAASVQIKGRVIYVASSTDAPVSLFITPENSEAVAISLTLVPCSLPPRELTLLLDGGAELLRTVGEGKDTAATGEEPLRRRARARRRAAHATRLTRACTCRPALSAGLCSPVWMPLPARALAATRSRCCCGSSTRRWDPISSPSIFASAF